MAKKLDPPSPPETRRWALSCTCPPEIRSHELRAGLPSPHGAGGRLPSEEQLNDSNWKLYIEAGELGCYGRYGITMNCQGCPFLRITVIPTSEDLLREKLNLLMTWHLDQMDLACECHVCYQKVDDDGGLEHLDWCPIKAVEEAGFNE